MSGKIPYIDPMGNKTFFVRSWTCRLHVYIQCTRPCLVASRQRCKAPLAMDLLSLLTCRLLVDHSEKYSSNWIISPSRGENKESLKPSPSWLLQEKTDLFFTGGLWIPIFWTV